MSGLRFDNDATRVQRAAAQRHDLVIRRGVGLAALTLRTGERVSEVGCRRGIAAVRERRSELTRFWLAPGEAEQQAR